MLPRKQRFKVWGALMVLGAWFFGCYSLVSYRLKSDDLELMEREVYEELQKKKEVERFLQRQRLEDKDKGKISLAGAPEIARSQITGVDEKTKNELKELGEQFKSEKVNNTI